MTDSTSRLLDLRNALTRADSRRPWLLDSTVPVVVLLLSLPGLVDRGALTVSVAVLLPALAVLLVPLWWRRRAPAVVFAVTVVVLLVEWSLDIWLSTGVLLWLVVLYDVAGRCSTAVLAWAGGVTAVTLTVAVYGLRDDEDHRLAAVLLLLGTFAGAVALGLAVRTRRAYLTALEDRAARLEVERDQQARLAVADERARVAREMHDIVGHHVSVVVGLADGAAALAAGRGEQTVEPLRLIGETGRQALAELRRVLGVLRDEDADPQLSPQPGVADLDRLLPSVRAAGLPVTYRTSGDLATLGRGVQLAVYRIVQEALTNALKHAGHGAAAEVTLTAGDGEVRVHVSNSGTAKPGRPNQGVIGMRERAAVYGGTLTAGPAPGGWLVEAVLPADTVQGEPA